MSPLWRNGSLFVSSVLKWLGYDCYFKGLFKKYVRPEGEEGYLKNEYPYLSWKFLYFSERIFKWPLKGYSIDWKMIFYLFLRGIGKNPGRCDGVGGCQKHLLFSFEEIMTFYTLRPFYYSGFCRFRITSCIILLTMKYVKCYQHLQGPFMNKCWLKGRF